MAPFPSLPAGCYPPVTGTWELTNQWTGRSTLVYSTRLQPAQWSRDVWDNAMLHTGVPQYALEEFHRLNPPDHRNICDRIKDRSRSRGRDRVGHSPRKPSRSESRSRSRSRGRNHDIAHLHMKEYKNHIPSKRDFAVKRVEKRPSEKELKSIMKHKDSRIYFDDIKGPYYGFNTFSEHTVVYDGFRFPTAEHLLLYFKFEEWPQIGHYLRDQWTVDKLWEAAEQFADRKLVHWRQEKLFYMEVVLWYKFTQHKSLKKLLLDTGDRHVTFVSPIDSFWGAGRDGKGKNHLGKALEKIRWRIRTCTPPVRGR